MPGPFSLTIQMRKQKALVTRFEAKLQIFFDQNKQGLQLFQRKHDQSLEIVKIANDFVTLTKFYQL